ncbi:MAG: sigma-70 family RNA polymerase sigma factor [Phycisphaerae bacterium]|nr:sigma-70 family RNA polymerase sigma factor [Phycisphaerae bacterium]
MTSEVQSLDAARIDVARWIESHGDAVWRFALARTRSREAAEEIVQETFLAALVAHRRFVGASSPQTWLLGIAAHKISEFIRRARRGRREHPIESDIASADGGEDLPDSAESAFGPGGKWRTGPKPWKFSTLNGAMGAHERAEHDELRRALVDCIDRLAPGVAETVWLRDILGMPSDEVCKALNLTATNLWTRLHRARSALRLCVERATQEQRSEAK